MQDKQYKYRFSVFTATYNRGHLLRNVYDKLQKQTFKDFEWVIVSDGSTDNTDAVVQTFIDEGKLPIKYVKKENGGKHTAWRMATPLFEGRYEVGADDDDDYPETALESFNRVWTELEQSADYDKFWEVRARCQREDGRMVGTPTPGEYFDSDYNEMRYVHHIDCEMQGCRKVEVLATDAAVTEHFLFEGQCSNFPEGIRWTRAARHYKTRFVNDIVRVYVKSPVALSGSAINKRGGGRNTKKTFNNLILSIYSINEQRDLMLKYSLKGYFHTCCAVAYQSIAAGVNPFTHIINSFDKVLIALSYIPMRLLFTIRG